MFTTKSIIRGGDVIRDEWSLTFDGTDDNIDCGDIGSPNDYQTYIGWLKNLQESGDGKKIALNHTKGNVRIGIGFNNHNEILANCQDAAGVGTKNVSGYVSEQRWFHVAITWDTSLANDGTQQNSLKLYVNGIAQTGSSGVGMEGADKMMFGASATGTKDWNGQMADVSIYTTLLSPSEILVHYNDGLPFNPYHIRGLAGWWRFGDGAERNTGSTVYDMSRNSNNGTLANFPATPYTPAQVQEGSPL